MMEKTIEGLNSMFKIKVQKDIGDFLGCEIKELNGGFQPSQSSIVNSILNQNSDYLTENNYKTPVALDFSVARPSK